MPNSITDLLSEIFKAINNLAGVSFFELLKSLIASMLKKVRKEGMYEVLDYESILELVDIKGYKARFGKREKIRYLQDNIIAFQDQAWGAGKILVDYQCRPGFAVDRYRLGSKTYNLISLREVKSRDDVDDFETKMEN